MLAAEGFSRFETRCRVLDTYCVGCRVLLLGADDTAAALSGVQGRLAADDGLALGSAGSADLAANLGDVIPVGHCGGSVVGGGVVWGAVNLLV